MSFTIREFAYGETVGEKLRAMRREAKITRREAAALTKIRPSILAALEENAYAALPETIYVRNFLKTYVQLLGGDSDYFIERFEKERGTCDFTKASRLPRAKTGSVHFLVASRYIKISITFLLVLAVMAYLGSQLYTITAPPALTIFEPADGFVTGSATLNVRGLVEEGTLVKIDGNPIILNRDKTFQAGVVLQRGANLITITAAKRYSREAVVYRRVILEQN